MLRNSEGIIVRLLIVEDEVRLASALQRGLIGEGFSVDVTHTGPDGLHAAQENQYDAVILDIMLPGLSGYRIIVEHTNAQLNQFQVLSQVYRHARTRHGQVVRAVAFLVDQRIRQRPLESYPVA